METITISKELETKIATEIENTTVDFYFDNRSGLENSSKEKMMGTGIQEWLNELWEYNIDYVSTLEQEAKKEVLESYTEETGLEIDELLEMFEDYYPSVQWDVKDILGNENILLRVELHSNYDCINSHHFEGGYEYEESYFGAMVDFLKLNPKKVKEILVKNGVEVYGSFPNLKHRDGKELVSYNDFWIELQNSCCGANLLTIPIKVNLYDLYTDYNGDLSNIKEITLSKGDILGLFSSSQGGGEV